MEQPPRGAPQPGELQSECAHCRGHPESQPSQVVHLLENLTGSEAAQTTRGQPGPLARRTSLPATGSESGLFSPGRFL